MKILHVLSQNELTGAEAYAVTLIRHQIQAGHEVCVVSDTLTLQLPDGVRFITRPIGRGSLKHRFINAFALKKIFAEFRPNVVHAHSRAASWVARIATIGGPALVSTIHGRQHWHTRLKKNDIYGQRIIAICGNIRQHLIQDFGISPKKVELIRNLVENGRFRGLPKPPAGKIRLGLFGRMSGPKGKIWAYLLRDVMPMLMNEFPNLEILIGGGDPSRLEDEDRKTLNQFLARFSDRAKFFGHSPDLAREIEKVDFVVGAGRIAIEALYAGRKVFGFGEYMPVGWITRSSLRMALLSNFGDVGSDRKDGVWWSADDLVLQLRSAFTGGISFDLQPEDLDRYLSEDGVCRQIESAYRQAILKKQYPHGIPSLMFHKVTEGEIPSRHRTFIDFRRFERLLTYIGWLRKTTITFADLQGAILGERPFPKRPLLLTFDDGYRDTLERAAPALARRGMKAVAYLLADPSVRSNDWDTRVDPSEPASALMTLDERKALKDTGVFEIGSHGFRHDSLENLPQAEREGELVASKRTLEKEFGTDVLSFAYTYGNHTEADSENANRAGYLFAVGTDTEYGTEENLFRIFRANVFPSDGFFSMLKKTSIFYRPYFQAKRNFRTSQRERRGLFSPIWARRVFPAIVVATLLYSFLGVDQNEVVASTPRFRNVYGEVLVPCMSMAGGLSLDDFCKGGYLATTPTGVCVEGAEGSLTLRPHRECVTVENWLHLQAAPGDYRTVWDATNIKILSRLPTSVSRRFYDRK